MSEIMYYYLDENNQVQKSNNYEQSRDFVRRWKKYYCKKDDNDYRITLKVESYNGFTISTIFTTYSVGVDKENNPYLFQTMIFPFKKSFRFISYEETMKGHENAKKWIDKNMQEIHVMGWMENFLRDLRGKLEEDDSLTDIESSKREICSNNIISEN